MWKAPISPIVFSNKSGGGRKVVRKWKAYGSGWPNPEPGTTTRPVASSL